MLRAQDVVVDQHVRIPERFGRLGEIAHGRRIAVEPGLRENGTDLHRPSVSHRNRVPRTSLAVPSSR